jgi:hypothetical protein
MALDAELVARLSDTDTLRVVAGSDDSVLLNGGWDRGRQPRPASPPTRVNGSTVQVEAGARLVVNGAFELGDLDGANGARFDGATGGASGFSIASVGDFNNDGLDDFIIGGQSPAAGVAHVVFGRSGAFAATVTLDSLNGSDGFRIEGVSNGDAAGQSVRGAGDFNGDGIADLLVGAVTRDGGALNSGTAYLVFGGAAFNAALPLATLAANDGMVFDGLGANDHLGVSLSAAGDINGDGFADIILGAPDAAANGASSGASYVVFGGEFSGAFDLGALNGDNGFRLVGAAAGDNAAFVAGVGDINGDGYGDLVVGAPRHQGDAAGSGSSYVVFGKADGFTTDLDLGSLGGADGFRIDGVALNDQSGYSVSGAGDVNGDGLNDLLIGAGYADPQGAESGAAYVVFGKSTGFTASLSLATLAADSGFRIEGAAASDLAGFSIRAAGDVNGDGFDDMLVGALGANGGFGSAYLLFGADNGSATAFALSDIDGANGLRFDGLANSDSLGSDVSAAGDINGDGYADLLVSAAGADNNGANSGSTYVIHGRDFNGVVSAEGASGNDTLAGGDDADNLVGGRGNDIITGGDGIDALQGGAGDDTLTFDSIDRRIDGGSGSDTLRIVNGGASFDGSRHHVRNIESIDMRGGVASTLSLNALGVLDVAGGLHTLRVLGDSNDVVNLAGSWTASVIETGFTHYAAGRVSVDVADGLNVISGGSVALASLDGIDGMRIDGTVANDRLGASVSGGADVNGDGLADIVIGAPKVGNDVGAAYVVFGSSSTSAATLALASLTPASGFRIDGAGDNDWTGNGVALVGDFNGDELGASEILIGAPHQSGVAPQPGASYLVFGGAQPVLAPLQVNALGSSGVALTGIEDMDYSGFAVSSAGDFNGDGFADLATVSSLADRAGVDDVGAAYLMFGGNGALDGSVALASLTGSSGFKIEGANFYQVQAVGSAGDINGDGLDDLILGGEAATADTRAEGGMAFVIFGVDTAPVAAIDLGTMSADSGFRVEGLADGDHLGASVAGIGDFNGDGFDDIAIGAPKASPTDAGSTYVIFGHAGAFQAAFDLATLDGSNGFRIDGVTANGNSGRAVSGAGDVNGDGYADLLIGAPGPGSGAGTGAGASFVLFGAGTGFAANFNMAAIDGHNGLRLDGRTPPIGTDISGSDVSAAGDLNGDGYGDILVGAQGFGAAPGSAYVVYGRDFTGTVDRQGGSGNDSLTGSSADEQLVGGLGNDTLDGVSGADVLIGGAGDDVLVWHTGARHVDGGSGADTLRIDGANITLDFTALANHTATGVERIDLTGSGDNTLNLDFRDLLALSDTQSLRIDGDAGDTVTSAGQGWTENLAGQDIGGQHYRSYSHLGGTLLIDSDITRTAVT